MLRSSGIWEGKRVVFQIISERTFSGHARKEKKIRFRSFMMYIFYILWNQCFLLCCSFLSDTHGSSQLCMQVLCPPQNKIKKTFSLCKDGFKGFPHQKQHRGIAIKKMVVNIPVQVDGGVHTTAITTMRVANNIIKIPFGVIC